MPPNSSQVPQFTQTVGCRFCPKPIINVSDVILCDFPLFHQQDVWDIYSEVTWNDGDNAKYKSFDRVGIVLVDKAERLRNRARYVQDF